jgi:uncharacterized integral membrane protein
MKDDPEMNIDTFKTGSGQCVVSDEEIRIEKSYKLLIKRRYEGNRRFTLLIAGVLLWLLLSLLINDGVFSRVFALLVFAIAVPLLLLITVVSIFQHRTRNITNDSVISLSAVESVRFTDSPTGLFIEYMKNGDEVSVFVPFAQRWYSWVDDAIETAQTVFERRDIPIHGE